MRLLPTPAAASLTLSPSMAGRYVPPYTTGRLPEGTKARWPRPGLPSNGRRARTRLGSAARGCGNGNGSVERGGSAVCAPGPWRRWEAFLPELGFLRRSEGQGRGRLCTAPRCPLLTFYRLRTVKPFLSVENSLLVKLSAVTVRRKTLTVIRCVTHKIDV